MNIAFSDRVASLQRKATHYGYAFRSGAMRALDRIPRRTGTTRLLLIDPGLFNFSGHHFEFNSLLKKHFSSTHDVTVYSHIRAAASVVARLKARPVFELGPYRTYRVGQFDRVYSQMTESTAAGLSKIDPRDLGPETLAILHTVTIFQLGGVAEWYERLPQSQRPRLLLQFHIPLEFGVHENDHANAVRRARDASTRLAGSGRVYFACNSNPLAARLADQLGQPCATLAIPLTWPGHAKSPDPGVVFGFFGGLRPEKGARLLAEAIPIFAQGYPEVRFIVHAPPRHSDPAAARILEKVRQVELIQGSFQRKEEYFATLCRSACVLLAYNPARYAIRTSGVFLEALGLGRLIITTSGTWMEKELIRYPDAGIMMPQFTAHDLVEALYDARQRIRGGADCSTMREDVMRENSGRAFCAQVFKLMEQ